MNVWLFIRKRHSKKGCFQIVCQGRWVCYLAFVTVFLFICLFDLFAFLPKFLFFWQLSPSGWREAKKSNREEKEKFEINFSSFERRKRNLILISPTSRGEREIWNWFLQFREEKEKYEFPFLSFEKRKRNQKKYSQLSRRERERYILCSSFEKRKRNLT